MFEFLERYDAAIWLPVLGIAAGIVMGFAARSGHFCTLSAFERHWYAGDSSGLRTWALAIAVAMAATQAMVLTGVVNISSSFYLDTSFGLIGAVVGGVMFGLGMALIGTCGFGALVRLGGGSLRSLIVFLFMAISALSMLYGILGLGRVEFLEPLSIELRPALSQSLPDLIEAWTGASLHVVLAVAIPVLIGLWIFSDRSYWGKWGQIATGVTIGVAIASGWLATSHIMGLSMRPVQLEAGSFVAPFADTLMLFAAWTGSWPDYGVGLVAGVVIGAAIASRLHDNVQWEACDDARELSRHIVGAVLMGVGGVAAIGCTIGQGVTAASTLAISSPIVLLSIALGARLGLAWLIEGSIRHAFASPADGRDRAPGE